MAHSPLILPGDPEFYETLGTNLPPAAPQMSFVVRPGSLLMEPVSADEFSEYVQGGEYDDRLAEMGDEDDGDEWWNDDE